MVVSGQERRNEMRACWILRSRLRAAVEAGRPDGAESHRRLCLLLYRLYTPDDTDDTGTGARSGSSARLGATDGWTAAAGIRAASSQDAGRVTGGERKVSTGQRKEKQGVEQEEPDRPRCSLEIDSDRVAITNTDTGGWLSTGRNLNRPPGRCRTGCQLLPGEAGAIGVERVGACGVSLGDGLRAHLAVRGWWSHRPALSSHHV